MLLAEAGPTRADSRNGCRTEFFVEPGRPIPVSESAPKQNVAPVGFRDARVVLELPGMARGEQDDRGLDALTTLLLRPHEPERIKTA